ncbi:MAG: C10 family peptidase [Prevotellaceae bacterium]|jgi:hypothetical protein|nr:C10 family peptidase [Prevotellaceae bacterium]
MKTVNSLFVTAILLFALACTQGEEFSPPAPVNDVKFTDAELKVLHQMRNNDNLKNCGYTTDGVCGYSYDKVISSLKNNRPVLAGGYATKVKHVFLGINWYTSYEGGHEWVIDGYLNQRQPVTVTVTRSVTGSILQPLTRALSTTTMLSTITTTTTTTTYNYSKYLRINWGWSGDDNGFYAAGCFDKYATRLNSNTKSSDPDNFQYANEIVPNIRR